MNIAVEYIDTAGTISNLTYRLSRLALIKHLAIAGQGKPSPKNLMRTLGMFLHYSYYLQREPFNNNCFSEPPIGLSDPTEKGQFSNIAGKAIADFLSKRINRSLFTVNYEAAMRLRGMPIGRVSRPDLIAYSSNSMFALEAKGFTGGSGNMATHKQQSTSGGIPVNFTVACVSYDLFGRVKCNYHDPYNQDVAYDNETLRRLTKAYYKELSGFLDNKNFRTSQASYQNEDFYEVDLFYPSFDTTFDTEPFFLPAWYHDILHFYRPRLILPINVRQLAETGITNATAPFLFDNGNDLITDTELVDSGDFINQVYIDNDRVGLRIR